MKHITSSRVSPPRCSPPAVCRRSRAARRRPRRAAPPPRQPATRTPPSPVAADYRLGARRQAAHRGLQGRAAVAVGPGPARRQDHAAADRRHRATGRTPIELRDAIAHVAEGLHHQPGGHGDRRRGDGVDGLRDGRGEPSRPDDAAGRPMTVLQALAMAGGLKDFADRKDIRILRKSVDAARRRSRSTTRTRSRATRSRSSSGPATPSSSLSCNRGMDELRCYERNAFASIALSALSLLVAAASARRTRLADPRRPERQTAPGGRSRQRSAFSETYDDNISLFGTAPPSSRTTICHTDFPGAELHFSGKHSMFSSAIGAAFSTPDLRHVEPLGPARERRSPPQQTAPLKWNAFGNSAACRRPIRLISAASPIAGPGRGPRRPGRPEPRSARPTRHGDRRVPGGRLRPPAAVSEPCCGAARSSNRRRVPPQGRPAARRGPRLLFRRATSPAIRRPSRCTAPGGDRLRPLVAWTIPRRRRHRLSCRRTADRLAMRPGLARNRSTASCGPKFHVGYVRTTSRHSASAARFRKSAMSAPLPPAAVLQLAAHLPRHRPAVFRDNQPLTGDSTLVNRRPVWSSELPLRSLRQLGGASQIGPACCRPSAAGYRGTPPTSRGRCAASGTAACGSRR